MSWRTTGAGFGCAQLRLVQPTALTALRTFRQQLSAGLGYRQASLFDPARISLEQSQPTDGGPLEPKPGLSSAPPSTGDAPDRPPRTLGGCSCRASRDGRSLASARRPLTAVWLERPLLADPRLPWERPTGQPLTPQVQPMFVGLLVGVATPAHLRPFGKSHGGRIGQAPSPAPRFSFMRRPPFRAA